MLFVGDGWDSIGFFMDPINSESLDSLVSLTKSVKGKLPQRQMAWQADPAFDQYYLSNNEGQ